MLERATCVDPSSRVNVCARWLEIQAVIIVPMPHQNGGHGCQVGSMLSEFGGVVLKRRIQDLAERSVRPKRVRQNSRVSITDQAAAHAVVGHLELA